MLEKMRGAIFGTGSAEQWAEADAANEVQAVTASEAEAVEEAQRLAFWRTAKRRLTQPGFLAGTAAEGLEPVLLSYNRESFSRSENHFARQYAPRLLEPNGTAWEGGEGPLAL